MCVYFSICVSVYTHMYTEIWTEIKKIARRSTIGEFGNGYVHCIVFVPFWKL